jgi:bifunctional non-homologous end joining protein LigD
MAGRKAGANSAKKAEPGGEKRATKAAAPGGAKSKVTAARGARGKDEPIAGVRLSHPDRVLYPEQGITKRALAHYYEEVADHILPHLVDRPLTLVRCPAGQGKPCFFQKHTSQGLSEAVRTVPITDKSGPDLYMAIDSLEGLITLVQMGALELHVWGSRTDRLEQPDRLVLDLDPAPDLSWGAVMAGARAVRAWLQDLGLVSFVKTTGGKGLHVVVPITRGRADWDETKEFTKAIATSMAAENPTLYTATITKTKRTSKIFIDYLRNGRGATAVVAFSSRARPGATVATPLHWDELDAKLDPGDFTILTVPRRLARLRKDPWEGFSSMRQSITAEMKRRVGMAP